MHANEKRESQALNKYACDVCQKDFKRKSIQSIGGRGDLCYMGNNVPVFYVCQEKVCLSILSFGEIERRPTCATWEML